MGPLGFVIGSDWSDNKPRVMLEIREDDVAATPGPHGADAGQVEVEVEVELEVEAGSVSGAA